MTLATKFSPRPSSPSSGVEFELLLEFEEYRWLVLGSRHRARKGHPRGIRASSHERPSQSVEKSLSRISYPGA